MRLLTCKWCYLTAGLLVGAASFFEPMGISLLSLRGFFFAFLLVFFAKWISDVHLARPGLERPRG